MSDATRNTCVQRMMPAMRIGAVVWVVLAAGCTGLQEVPPSVKEVPPSVKEAPPSVKESPPSEKESPPSVMARPLDPSLPGRNRDQVAADLPLRSESIQKEPAALAPPPAAPRRPVITGDATSGSEPVAAAPAPPSTSQGAAQAAPPPAKAPAKVPAAAVAVEQPRKNVDASPAAKKSEPPLDIAALKARLRDTNAIGVFTKLALKNQVDDLLQQFRAHYRGGQKTSVAALRQPYDMLVLKVLALVQDSDPSLARTISGSREAIWGILADPEKFNSVT